MVFQFDIEQYLENSTLTYYRAISDPCFPLHKLNYKKIKKAERILLTKDVSVSQAAESIGMSNMAHFYMVFKKFNDCSPNEYRKKMDWNS